MNMRLRRLKGLLMLALAVALLLSAALAEGGDPEAQIKVPRGEYDERLMDIKEKLYQGGYYPDEFDASVLSDSTLDDWTMNAIGRFARANPDIPAYDGHGEGLTTKAWWDLSHNPIKALRALPSAPAAYRDIAPGDTDAADEVARIQDALIELGYLSKGDEDYIARELNGAVFRALRRFLERNGKPEWYDEHRVTAEAQALLLTDTDLLIGEEAPKGMDRLRAYFLGTTSLFGLRVRTLVIWLVGLILLILCILAMAHFFAPADRDPAEGYEAAPPKRRKHRPVTFEITYEGRTQTVKLPVDPILKIGRSSEAFPIDPADTEVSRAHCELFYRGRDLMLRDYSTFGTRVNGETVSNTQRKLKPGDVIGVGGHEIRVGK